MLTKLLRYLPVFTVPFLKKKNYYFVYQWWSSERSLFKSRIISWYLQSLMVRRPFLVSLADSSTRADGVACEAQGFRSRSSIALTEATMFIRKRKQNKYGGACTKGMFSAHAGHSDAVELE